MGEFIEVKIKIPPDLYQECIILLEPFGFTGFQEEQDSLTGYIDKLTYQKNNIEDFLKGIFGKDENLIVSKEIKDQNWNLEWEKNFDPVEVAGKVFVHASFHKPDPSYEYPILIQPQMAFGTGHHETTSLMMEAQLGIDHQGKKVLDVGTGSGILAILACKLGAGEITGIDNDPNAFLNAEVNKNLNHCPEIHLIEGDLNSLSREKKFDIILANITRNIILDYLPDFNLLLGKNGILLLSGILKKDADKISGMVKKLNLQVIEIKEKNNWTCIKIKKL